jgi:hypothetical protein
MLPKGTGDSKHVGNKVASGKSTTLGQKKREKPEEDREITFLRERMRTQYNAIKQKRRAEGHFHL